MKTNSMLLAALIGGVVMALVSSLPFISLINCLLCAGVWGSGILAVFSYRSMEKAHPGLTTGQGAILGGAAGVVGAIIATVYSAIFSGASSAAVLSALQSIPQFADVTNNIPAAALSSGGSIIGGLVCNLILYVIFGAIGGLLATGLIWKKA